MQNFKSCNISFPITKKGTTRIIRSVSVELIFSFYDKNIKVESILSCNKKEKQENGPIIQIKKGFNCLSLFLGVV